MATARNGYLSFNLMEISDGSLELSRLNSSYEDRNRHEMFLDVNNYKYGDEACVWMYLESADY
jgi:hypothetical protein